jgi:hypothetical protein
MSNFDLDKINNAIYDLEDNEHIEVHIKIGVNTFRNGKWVGFCECSIDEFEAVMAELKATRRI